MLVLQTQSSLSYNPTLPTANTIINLSISRKNHNPNSINSIQLFLSLQMDTLLCDELLQEIFQRLPPAAFSTTSLVCKRWLHLHRTTTTSVSLRIAPKDSLIPSVASFLSLYPSLRSLSVSSVSPRSSDNLLLCIASTCSNLRLLRLLSCPVTASALFSVASSFRNLNSLYISSSPPLCFQWLCFLPSLKELYFTKFVIKDEIHDLGFRFGEQNELGLSDFPQLASESSELPLETLCLSGIGRADRGLGWLWRSCGRLKRLELKSCEGLGDGNSFTSFTNCLSGLQELELRTCRTIVDGVLFQVAEHCTALESLLLYDGGSREGLLWFVNRARARPRRLDFRLPLDLKNDHLFAVAECFRGLVTLRLQSCCLVTGEGLKAIALIPTMSDGLEELALINCDVVDREPGLLTALGQNLKGLRSLDLSYNEMLVDKELVSMLVSCKNLIDVKLRGCKNLTNFAMVSMAKTCKVVENVDVVRCATIDAEGVEAFVLNSTKLKQVQVEECKVTNVAKKWAFQKSIEIKN